MRLEHLEADDWQRFRDIRMRALRADPDAFFTTAEDSEKLTEKQWRQRLTVPDSATFVVSSEDDEDVGLAAVISYAQSDAEPGDYELVAMWVAPEARRSGVSKLLVEAAITAATGHDARRLVLWVAWGNLRAEALYQQFGFKRTGETGSFPPPRNTPEFKMALKL